MIPKTIQILLIKILRVLAMHITVQDIKRVRLFFVNQVFKNLAGLGGIFESTLTGKIVNTRFKNDFFERLCA